jgi:hypothetical protein
VSDASSDDLCRWRGRREIRAWWGERLELIWSGEWRRFIS